MSAPRQSAGPREATHGRIGIADSPNGDPHTRSFLGSLVSNPSFPPPPPRRQRPVEGKQSLRKRPAKNVLVEIGKIVFGGLLGIALAAAILKFGSKAGWF